MKNSSSLMFLMVDMIAKSNISQAVGVEKELIADIE